MRISEIVKRLDRQIPLFIGALDQRISGMPQTRNLCGDFMEDLTAGVGSAVRLATNGMADYCPDCRRSELIYFECKSAGKNGTVIIYDERLKADEEFCAVTADGMAERALYYWIWRHDLSIAGIGYRDELRIKLSWHLKYAVVLPLPAIAEVARQHKLKLLNSAYRKAGKPLGYGQSSNRKRYGYGYSIPVNELKALCNTTVLTRPIILGGIPIQSQIVHTLDRCAFLLEEKPCQKQYRLW